MDLKDLKLHCERKSLNLTQKQLDQFQSYMDLLLSWNKIMNLTAITEPSEIIEKHFLDSLFPLLDNDLKGSLCDVGSGAGFPSIPMKIVCPQLSVTIIEPLQKRCRFLNEVVSVLGLENVTIINARSEDIAREKRESFDIVIARALAQLPMLCELCIPHVKVGGIFIAMKAEKGFEEAKASENAIKVLGCQLEKIDRYETLGFKRYNFIYRKVKKTPLQYPRAFAKIKHKTL